MSASAHGPRRCRMAVPSLFRGARLCPEQLIYAYQRDDRFGLRSCAYGLWAIGVINMLPTIPAVGGSGSGI